MRQYVRYPTDIPVEYGLIGQHGQGRYCMRNVSEGGLCFSTEESIEPRTEIHIAIPVCNPTFEVDGKVVWCRQLREGEHDVGVQFDEPATEFAIRMVQQVRHIENYRKKVYKDEGRELSPEQAAAECLWQFQTSDSSEAPS